MTRIPMTRGHQDMATLYRVILPVGNIERAALFYCTVFNQSGERVSPGRHYIECGGTILALYDPVQDGDPVGEGWRFHSKQYLYFAVSDLEDYQSRFKKAGGTLTEEIAVLPWGERMFYGLDPFGNPLSFVAEDTVFRGGEFHQ